MKNIIHTERLTLREFNTDDAAFIIELLNSPSWIKYIGNRKVQTIEDAKSYLERAIFKGYKENGFGLWMVELRATQEPIGMCGLIKREGLDDVDIGFAFLPQYEGKGYGSEAANATMFIAKEKGIKRIVAITVKYNTASIKLLEKIGLRFEKHITMPNDDEELMLFGIDLPAQ